MTKKETLKWRLSKLPTSDEVLALIKDGVITKDEGKEILFSTETEEERDEASLKAEIKFLRELVEKLAEKKQDRIVNVIRDVETRYIKQPWYDTYKWYCNNDIVLCANTATDGSQVQYLSNSGTANTYSFTNLKTF